MCARESERVVWWARRSSSTRRTIVASCGPSRGANCRRVNFPRRGCQPLAVAGPRGGLALAWHARLSRTHVQDTHGAQPSTQGKTCESFPLLLSSPFFFHTRRHTHPRLTCPLHPTTPSKGALPYTHGIHTHVHPPHSTPKPVHIRRVPACLLTCLPISPSAHTIPFFQTTQVPT